MSPPTNPESTASKTSEDATGRDAFEIHRQMVIALFISTVAIAVLLATLFLGSSIPTLLAVAFAGALGGFVSALRRLYTFQRVFPANFFASWPQKPRTYLI